MLRATELSFFAVQAVILFSVQFRVDIILMEFQRFRGERELTSSQFLAREKNFELIDGVAKQATIRDASRNSPHLAGLRTTVLKCIRESNQAPVSERRCRNVEKPSHPPPLRCNDHPCAARYCVQSLLRQFSNKSTDDCLAIIAFPSSRITQTHPSY